MATVWLCGFAFLAGFVDAIVGGGGLIQIPALFLLLPAGEAAVGATVLGTNKLSSICGTAMAVVQYSRRIKLNWASLLPGALTALGFSYLGARVVASLSTALLRPLLLVLLVVVAAYTYAHHDLGTRHAPRFATGRESWLSILVGAAIGFYDGFFGPGTGSFLIFIFVGWFGFEFLTASASAKVINCATNLSAVAFFAATNHILYERALPMGAANLAGSLLGTRLAMWKGNRFVRGFFLIVVAVLILRYGWEAAKGLGS